MAGLLERLSLLWLLAAIAIVASQPWPGCPDKCGNVTISYPFGIEDGCYLNTNFGILCDKSSEPHTPYLMNTNIPVTNMSPQQGQLEILQFVAKDCYKNGLREEWSRPWLWVPTMFNISSTKNKFTAVGCDTQATVTGNRESRPTFTGCMSYCYRPSDLVNGSCSGIGCCQVPIPGGIKNISLSISSYYNYSYLEDLMNPCSYAFVAEESKFNFSLQSFDDLRNIDRLPIVLDWAIGNQSCEIISKNKHDYACKENSTCHTYGSGYRCECKEGYKGNPYLQNQNGCQDVNECKDGSHKCKYRKHCTNTMGNYTCSCPKGYEGDGRTDGSGCQLKVIEFSIGMGVSTLVVLVGVSWLFFIYNKRKLLKMEMKFFEQNGGKMLQNELNQRQISSETALIFTAEQLKEATNNYNESRILGKGGFGTVYKGILKNGREVAIKKPKTFDQSQVKTFIYEFIFLSQISHENVVKLLGCCLEREVPLLVYEFVANGTLSDHIHGKNRASTLSWGVRLRVAAETANALACLHSATPPIIHRDVKPENILLDDNYTAKVSDFGASRLVPVDQTQSSTMIQGTFGYLDPEYFHTGQFTEKSDVYSFGVVLVELLTGKRAIASNRPEKERSLVNVFLSSLKDDDNQYRLFQILDDQVAKEGPIELIKEVAEIGKRCLRVNGEERPDMEQVAMELKELSMMGNHPWVGVQVNLEETEHLLRRPSISPSSISDNATASTTYGNSSIVKQEAFEISDGR
ncbi:hypothetical protein COLO4_25790 [Corchorus olitorius]|uniref:Protein kinase domain-containing protein n=1 Tax=Corchorus olitorius TaxID=93759 RepID=A0A1R3I005_9ROSI|nr:hypothetical protein COLO4_25790 [Corchorus olitorius]